MSRFFTTIYKEVEVDVDWEDVPTEDLIEALELRGAGTPEYGDGKGLLESIYQKRRAGQDYEQDLKDLIYLGLGKIA
jgi:hypothetical protein